MLFVIGFAIGSVIIVPMVLIFIFLGALYQGFVFYSHWVMLIHWWEPIVVIMGALFLMMWVISNDEDANEDIVLLHVWTSLGLLLSLYLGAWLSHWKWLFMIFYESIGLIVNAGLVLLIVVCVLFELYDLIFERKIKVDTYPNGMYGDCQSLGEYLWKQKAEYEKKALSLSHPK